jgi:Flp pilus assembly protein TadG
VQPRDEQGQAATELALVLPLLVLLLLAVVQVTLVARDQVLVVHAAREGAREAAVDLRPGAVRRAALLAGSGLKAGRLGTETSQTGGAPVIVIVRVVYRAPTDVALIGPLLPDIEVRAKAAMRQESPAELGKSPPQDSKPAGRAPPRSEPTGRNLGRGPGAG